MDEPVLRIMEGRRRDGTVLLTVQGEIDMSTVEGLRARLSGVCETEGQVTIDLRRVGFLDCLGLRLLVDQAERSARCGCELSFIQGPPVVARLFEMTGTLDQLHFVDAVPRSLPATASAG